MLGGGEGWILVYDRSRNRTIRMIGELAAEHFTEFRPRHQSGQANVGSHEAFAVVVHKFQQLGPLLVGEGISRWPMKKIASAMAKLGPPLAGWPLVCSG